MSRSGTSVCSGRLLCHTPRTRMLSDLRVDVCLDHDGGIQSRHRIYVVSCSELGDPHLTPKCYGVRVKSASSTVFLRRPSTNYEDLFCVYCNHIDCCPSSSPISPISPLTFPYLPLLSLISLLRSHVFKLPSCVYRLLYPMSIALSLEPNMDEADARRRWRAPFESILFYFGSKRGSGGERRDKVNCAVRGR